MFYNVTFITVDNKRISVTIEAEDIHKAIQEVTKHPDYDILVEAVEE